MPNYNAQVPLYWIFPGDVALAFNNEAPAAGQDSRSLRCPATPAFPRTSARSVGHRSTRELRASEGDCDFRWHGRDGADSRLRLRRLALRSV
jgi:hypothetical protein